MGKLDLEARMTIQHLRSRGLSQSSIARLLGVTEGAVRYHVELRGVVDGRFRQERLASRWAELITTWLASLDEASPINLAALHSHLVSTPTPGVCAASSATSALTSSSRRSAPADEWRHRREFKLRWTGRSIGVFGSRARSRRPTGSTSS